MAIYDVFSKWTDSLYYCHKFVFVSPLSVITCVDHYTDSFFYFCSKTESSVEKYFQLCCFTSCISFINSHVLFVYRRYNY